MARTRRLEVSRARGGVSVRGERRIVRSPDVPGPAAASNACIQQNGTPHGAPSGMIMGSSLVPPSRVEFQPEVQTGGLADGLGVHQPMQVDLQPTGTDFDVLTLADLDATPLLESIETIGAANSQTVFPLGFGNQSSVDSPFQSHGPLAGELSCGAGYPASNILNAAPTPPTASDYYFPALGPDVISPLPEMLPLQEAEQVHMLDQLFPPEQDQSQVENVSSLFPPNQLHQPNHLEGPMEMVSCDPPSHPHTSLSLLGPLGEMIQHLARPHPQSFPFRNWHQQSPQQPLTDLDGGMQHRLLGRSPSYSFSSNEPYAMEYAAGGPPFPISNAVSAIVPNIVEAVPKLNTTPFDSLGQSPDTRALLNSVRIFNESAAHSASANHTNVAAPAVQAGRGRRLPRNRTPHSRLATVGRLRQNRSARTPDESLATMTLADVVLGRIETKRQSHMRAERQKRKKMNELYATMRSLLPPASRKMRPDNATLIEDMINCIERRKNELKVLEQQIKLMAALSNVNPNIHHTDTAAARLLTTKGFTCVDRTHDPSALTAVTTVPALENYTGLGAFLGTNVAINYCHDHYSLTVSSPYVGQAVALLEPMLVAIRNHGLEVLFASIVTRSNTHIYYLQCQASLDTELLRSNLHSVLQDIIINFSSSSSSQEHHG